MGSPPTSPVPGTPVDPGSNPVRRVPIHPSAAAIHAAAPTTRDITTVSLDSIDVDGLERKDRAELATIAEALGGKP
ncbi:MAG TPA: hypothetical protein PKC57_14360, partial [Microthrixaceae bacterium]|nr:hypothetical protein [Microthrixaceae bacterium]